MRSTRVLVMALAVLALAIFLGLRVRYLRAEADSDAVDVGIVYDSAEAAGQPAIRGAIDEIFLEEGVPHEWISVGDLSLMDAAALGRRYRVLVFPDGLDARLPDDIESRMLTFEKAGGDVVVTYDAGTKDNAGAYLDRGRFESLLGVRYGRVQQFQNSAFGRGPLQFASAAVARSWHVPPGKLDAQNAVTGYGYGRLQYPIANAQTADGGDTVIARAGGLPALAVRAAGGGKALWSALPIGALAADGDDLPLRWIVESFVVDSGQMPHLIASPGGVGALIFSWHFDGASDRTGAGLLLKQHLLRPDLHMEIDIASGPDEDAIGDGQGFDACGKGEALVREVSRFGNVGSHGGWDHNWYARALERGALSRAQIEDLVRKNSDCLTRATGVAVRTYAAPVGVHPQPMLTQVLEKIGLDAYYYTGDNGGPPTRPYYHGAEVSQRVWAVPVMPNGKLASLGEMGDAHVPPAAIAAWYDGVTRFVVRNRTMRLVYSHPHDLLEHPEYIAPLAASLSHIETAERMSELRTIDMEQAAAFMTRLTQTDFEIKRRAGGTTLLARNPGGLHDIAFAVPNGWMRSAALPAGVSIVGSDGGWTVLNVTRDATQVSVDFTGIE